MVNASYFIDKRDERYYKTSRFGKQIWMTENLAYECINSYVYDNDNFYKFLRYGRLYTWDAAMKAVPDGWHLPSDEEWDELTKYLGSIHTAGRKMQESKFNVLLSGYRYHGGSFYSMGSYAYFWSSSQYGATRAWARALNSSYSNVYLYGGNKNYGYSIRCIKD